MRIAIHIALLGALAGGLACHAGDLAEPGLPQLLRGRGAPQYRGPIVQVDSVQPRLLLQYRPAGLNSGRIWIAVPDDTPVFSADGNAVRRAALQPGVVLSVWSQQPVMESDPAQTGADAILIGG